MWLHGHLLSHGQVLGLYQSPVTYRELLFESADSEDVVSIQYPGFFVVILRLEFVPKLTTKDSFNV